MAISTRARELKAQGVPVISFGAGEPDFPTPEHIVAAAARASHDPANHRYSANAGLAPLREAIAQYTGTYSGVEVDASEVAVTNGAKQAVFQCVDDIGDRSVAQSEHQTLATQLPTWGIL